MLVSVIVPVYNVEKYLRKCLDSIINQTYKEIEIIIVDDGSKDNSGQICDEYSEKYDNIVLIHKKNQGLGMARNTGMEYMRGEYVTFVDSDDYIGSTMIEKLVENIEKNNVDMCKSGLQPVDENDRFIPVKRYENTVFEGEKAKKILLPRLIGSSPKCKDSIRMGVTATLYKTSYIYKYNLKFPSERELISEDIIFNIDYMQHINGACTIDLLEYYNKYNPKSLTRSYRKDRFDASKKLFLEIKNRLLKLNYDNNALLRLSRMFFVYIKLCVIQENPKVSKNKINVSLKNISNICKDDLVQETINNYPVEDLGFKQRTFLKFIINNNYKLLFLFTILKLR